MNAVTKGHHGQQLTHVAHSGSRVFGKAVALLVLTCYSSNVASVFHFYLHTVEQWSFGDAVVENSNLLKEYTVSTGSGKMPVNIFFIFVTAGKLKSPSVAEEYNVEHGKAAVVVPFLDGTNRLFCALHAATHRQKHGKGSLLGTLHEIEGQAGEVKEEVCKLNGVEHLIRGCFRWSRRIMKSPRHGRATESNELGIMDT